MSAGGTVWSEYSDHRQRGWPLLWDGRRGGNVLQSPRVTRAIVHMRDTFWGHPVVVEGRWVDQRCHTRG